MLTYSYSSLGTSGAVQAAGADAIVNDHILTITGAPPMDVRLIENFSITNPTSATAQQTTITPTTLAANLEYSIQINQWISGRFEQVMLSYLTKTGDTATIVCDAWKLQLAPWISSGKLSLTASASGTGTLILTASTTDAVFNVTQVYTMGGNAVGFSPSPASGTITISTGTPGVNANGTYAALTAQGITTTPALVAGQNYIQVRIIYRLASVSEAAGDVPEARIVHTVLIYSAATNIAALSTRLSRIQNGLDPTAGTVADPEFLSIV
jgi:hypothetical protein